MVSFRHITYDNTVNQLIPIGTDIGFGREIIALYPAHLILGNSDLALGAAAMSLVVALVFGSLVGFVLRRSKAVMVSF